jgi:hypothetical protein
MSPSSNWWDKKLSDKQRFQLQAPQDPSLLDVAAAVPNPVGDVASGLLAVQDVSKGNYGSAALNSLGLLPFVPAMGAMTAFHGSPYKFDKFDSAKIGSGEGAQAYGHGLYFADNPEVAASYMPNFAFKEAQNYLFTKNIDDAVKSAEKDLNSMIKGNSPQSSINDQNEILSILLNKQKNQSQLNKYFSSKTADEIENAFVEGGTPKVEKYLKKNNLLEYKPEVNKYLSEISGSQSLYKVDIPDESIPKMLDWDKPLNQQHSNVQKAWDNFTKANPKYLNAEISGGQYKNPTGQDFHSAIFEESPSMGIESRKLVADFLKKQGITGVKYLDQGSRGVGKGTSNYVVFDPEKIKILERNGLLTD